ncbi:MAG: hypothetical protein KAV82_08040 [Phycisphaerae bacterium]|nr:hypothetical protein [Phycisphaerae bacterium]
MSIKELRQRAKERIEHLSEGGLKSALDYLDFLEMREEEDATEELLRIPGFEEGMERAERDIAAGRVTDWRKARQDV